MITCDRVVSSESQSIFTVYLIRGVSSREWRWVRLYATLCATSRPTVLENNRSEKPIELHSRRTVAAKEKNSSEGTDTFIQITIYE